MSDFGLSFGWPTALLGMAILPVLLVFLWRSRVWVGRARRIAVAITRLLAVALIVLAVADARVVWPTDELAVAVVTDASPSVTDGERLEFRQKISQLSVAHPETAWVDVAPLSEPEASDLAPDVQLAVATLPRDRVRRIIVATDGHDRGGRLRNALDVARRDRVQVSFLPIGDRPAIDTVGIDGVSVPRLIRAGETLDLGVALRGSIATRTRLTVQIDGNEVASEEVRSGQGVTQHRLAITFPDDEGVKEVVVTARPDQSGRSENDRWRTLVRVVSRPRVLIIHDAQTEPLLATVLRDARMNVTTVRYPDAPTQAGQLEPYSLVLMDEMDPADLSEEQQRALRTWVEEGGGGFIDVTGDTPVRRDPPIIREMEPVRPPPWIPEPRPLELVQVIDRSSSMEGRPMSSARNAGIAGIRALRSDALIGVVAFSDGADRVMAPVPSEQFAQAEAFVRGIHASGGTNIAAALNAAGRIMSNDPRYIHHIILISDGESDPASAIAAAQALAARGISISVVTIGMRSELMAEIARIGRGRYHVTQNAGSLPALFVREAQWRQPPASKNVRFRTSVRTQSSLIEGVDIASAPELGGYALAETKRGADTILTSPEGPLLAHWHYGNGQVAMFCSDSTGGWSDAWRGWPGYRTFWSKLAWSMLRTRTTEPLEVRVSPHPDRADSRIVTVLTPTIGMEPVPITTISYQSGTSTPLELVARGPGIFQAHVPISAPGAAAGTRDGFVVDAKLPDDIEPTAAAGDDLPYPPELRRFGADRAALGRLADVGGGRVLESVDQILAGVQAAPVMKAMRLPLLIAALVLYLLGVLLLRIPERKMAAPVVVAAAPPKPSSAKPGVPAPPAPPKQGGADRKEAA